MAEKQDTSVADKSLSTTYFSGAVKNFFFLFIFWIAFFYLMNHYHGAPNLWTLEQLWDVLSGVSFFGIIIVLFAIGFGISGIIGSLIVGLGGSFLLAFLCDKAAAMLNIPIGQSDQLMGIVGIIINIIVFVKLIINFRNYLLCRNFETTEDN